MLIRHKKMFNLGVLLAISFLAVLVLIFSPIFGGVNGLDFADNLFNKLSKGSSYFIPNLMKSNEKLLGTQFKVAIKLDKPEQVAKSVKILTVAGAQVSATGADLTISGDLGNLKGDFTGWRLEYGRGEDPSEWTVLAEGRNKFEQSGTIFTWDLEDVDPSRITLRIYLMNGEDFYAEKRVFLTFDLPTPTPEPTLTPTLIRLTLTPTNIPPTAVSTDTPVPATPTETFTPPPTETPTETPVTPSP